LFRHAQFKCPKKAITMRENNKGLFQISSTPKMHKMQFMWYYLHTNSEAFTRNLSLSIRTSWLLLILMNCTRQLSSFSGVFSGMSKICLWVMASCFWRQQYCNEYEVKHCMYWEWKRFASAVLVKIYIQSDIGDCYHLTEKYYKTGQISLVLWRTVSDFWAYIDFLKGVP
jgi:hypothetical protein